VTAPAMAGDPLLDLIGSSNDRTAPTAMPEGLTKRMACSSPPKAFHVQQLARPLASNWVPLWAGGQGRLVTVTLLSAHPCYFSVHSAERVHASCSLVQVTAAQQMLY
jgi:hypothetical protein